MFLVNAMKGTLIKRNRPVYDENNNLVEQPVYDDEVIKEVPVKLCPYNQDIRVAFGVYTIPEAEGYYIVKSNVDIKEGDQISFMGKTYSVLKVKDNWIWNRIENFTVAVK
jgi:hypothetical protein